MLITNKQACALGEIIIEQFEAPHEYWWHIIDVRDSVLIVDYGTVHSNGEHERAIGTIKIFEDGSSDWWTH